MEVSLLHTGWIKMHVAVIIVAFLTFVVRVIGQMRDEFLQKRRSQQRPGKYIRRFESWMIIGGVDVLNVTQNSDGPMRGGSEPVSVGRAA